LDAAKKRGGQTKCPICNTDISILMDDIIKSYDGYFDKGYENFIAELKSCKEQIKTAIDLINKCETNAGNLGRLWEKYKTQITGQSFKAFDFKTTKVELETILSASDSKLGNIQLSFKMPQSAIDSLSRSNDAIDGFIKLKNTCQTTLSAKKLDTRKIEDQIRKAFEEIVLLEFDQSDNGDNFDKYNQNQKRITTISTTDSTNVDGLLFHQNKRRNELKKIKTESRSISKYLKAMGIEHFIVDINDREFCAFLYYKLRSVFGFCGRPRLRLGC